MPSSLVLFSVYCSRHLVGIAILLSLVLASASGVQTSSPKLEPKERFHVVAFYSSTTEPDHVQFAEGALKFFSDLAARSNFTFESTTDWANMNDVYLKKY